MEKNITSQVWVLNMKMSKSDGLGGSKKQSCCVLIISIYHVPCVCAVVTTVANLCYFLFDEKQGIQ